MLQRTVQPLQVELDEFQIDLLPIDEKTIDDFKTLNLQLFPVVYAAEFYRNVLQTYPPSLSRIAYLDGKPIGAISCRVDGYQPNQAYIMTLGVIQPFRRLKLGSCLLDLILDELHHKQIEMVCLHVHVKNTIAVNFYLSHGFEIKERVYSYYYQNKAVVPPDAYYLVHSLN
ncbi:acyl-CoA N-acyltransferase [Gorgonomyces haynaldii]|nr:acyl-CoA N-acyltransferase [Gorgonomyces haynaldii]